ncbi:MAG: radical SAM protein [Bdellovibrionales bacterium]|nr:radical SAM protein [Bdellovibrionales bacterium]
MGFPVKTPEYEHLDELISPTSVFYGPVGSRRFGMTVGVNLLGEEKICSFDCPYCELGRTNVRMNQIKKDIQFLSPDEIESRFREGLRDQIDTGVNAIVISGNGEPTLYPQLFEVMDLLAVARDEVMSEVPLVIMTNGAHMDTRRTILGLEKADEVMIKVDAGNDDIFKTVNSPLVRSNIAKIIAGTRKLEKFSAQAFFVQGAIDNTTNSAVEEWMEVIGMMGPQKVYIYGLKRIPPISGLKAADEDTLYTIASKLKRRTSIEALVFP